MNYVVDTHTLLWYVTSDKQLSSRVEKILDEAHHKVNSIIILPSIVLMEAIDVLEKGKVSYRIDEFLNAMQNGGQYELAPISWGIIEEYRKIDTVLEIHDRLIVATALQWNARILTKDAEISKFYPQIVVW
ncbi:MAG: PIN domain-containing protein [Candidatus Jacksonbacteria bacterium]|nr:PIN domain-containing protein [Candidatus Jacksonbacteria bacterium]